VLASDSEITPDVGRSQRRGLFGETGMARGILVSLLGGFLGIASGVSAGSWIGSKCSLILFPWLKSKRPSRCYFTLHLSAFILFPWLRSKRPARALLQGRPSIWEAPFLQFPVSPNCRCYAYKLT